MKSPARITSLGGSVLPAMVLGTAAFLFPVTGNAGPVDKNPVVENLQRPFDWTGFYIGGNIGGALSEYEFRGTGGDTDGHLFSDLDIGQQFGGPTEAGNFLFRFIDRPEKDRPDREELRGSILGGGQVGYQHQFGHLVFGIEGDFDRTSMRSTQTFRDATGDPIILVDQGITQITADSTFTGHRRAESNWAGSIRGKFGWATGPLLFYGTAGISFAQVDVWADDTASTTLSITQDPDVPPPQPPHVLRGGQAPDQPIGGTERFLLVNQNIDRDDDVMVGYTAGFGLEVAFNDAVTLALEYRHNGYGDQSFHFNGDHGHGGPIFPGATNVNFDSDQVTVKMNVLLCHLFGHGGGMASATPAANNVAAKSPFGGSDESMQVGYTKAKDASKWSAKDKEVKVEEEFNWTGFYVGANVGGTWTDYDFSGFDTEGDVGQQFFDGDFVRRAGGTDAPQGVEVIHAFASFGAPPIDGGTDDSMIGGGQFGYQYQWNHWVFGVESDFSGLSSSKSTNYANTGGAAIDKTALAISTLYTERTATVDWMASARARFGYARGPVMLYVTGGGAWASVKTSATDSLVTDFFVPFNKGGDQNFMFRSGNTTNDEDVVGGWTAGGGAEWAFSKIATLAMEYRHSEFDNVDSHYDPHHSPIFAEGNSVDLQNDQVTVRVNLLLGHMGPGH